jgi:hypothetical protein
MYYYYYYLSLLINVCPFFFMVVSGNILSQLFAIQPLNGSNYGSWRETVEIALTLMEIDLALMTDAPKEPEKSVIHDGETADAFFHSSAGLRAHKNGVRP